MTALRLVFAGSPAAAVPSLRVLAASGHAIAAVITRTDSPQGRRGVLTPTPVAEVAEALGIPTIKANRLAGDATDAVTALQPDLGVIVAYGGLVREPLLSTPRLGWINLHFSLLPRWRGAAPVQRAIMAGDEQTGATVFQLVEELDAGDVYGRIAEPIGRLQTAGGLLGELAASGAELLLKVVDALADGTAKAEPQRGEVTLAPKLSLADGEIDWNQPAERVHDLIRGVTPEPGAFTDADGARLKVLAAAIARDAPPLDPGMFALVGKRVLAGTTTHPIELIQVHPAGRKAMDAASWWRGRPAVAQ
ncbi:methionyl-tRNA formyltransferase [Leifsonia sp. H3M29-4]|uniref:methionyl-tRNA formyltransferase n=1 Tax=Salinibacterium metalliresistens TaxID=3031321 RepID=UPI0023DADD35|nr:methionyl-tRNA formyltransferase [Salinibacterium metalliresistens]MDF1479824.1 methionyl-tRNA formyltransferase [Salinibacterium metalliresistens]